MLLRRWSVFLLAFFLFGPLLPAAFAQSASHVPQPAPPGFSLQGKVLDPAGASVAGATITGVPDGRPPGPSVLSDQHGDFKLTLEAGRYTIVVVADGFTAVSKIVDIPQTGAQSHEFVLPVSGVRETVTVTAPNGSQGPATANGTKTPMLLRDVPQSVTVVTRELIQDQLMTSLGDVVRYVPGVTAHQGENNRDQVIIRGNNSSADFFLDGVRDDVQYYRDLYNLDRVEALKGPNATIFGRGGGGGVINRVTKAAGFTPLREVSLLGGSYNTKRFTADLNQPFGDTVAFRINGMYENSDSFRTAVNLQRSGINPTLTIAPNQQTRITLGYEHVRDKRVADRGIPSYQGRPADTDVRTYFGNPDDSHVRSRVHLASAMIEHRARAMTIRNRTLIGNYDRGYQNFVPGAVTADKSNVALSAYNNHTQRLNVFNQSDLTYGLSTGPVRHTLLAGAEVGRQLTDNFRDTGYFNSTATSILVPYAHPTISIPITFRQSATDADNHLTTDLAAAYVQDQIELSRRWQVVAGLRFDRFDLRYQNNRTGGDLGRVDDLISPRVGVVIKPVVPLSLYASSTVSYLPSSGDQFSSLTAITQQVQPEKFSNYELGAKWDLPRRVSLTAAAYRLDRTNTRSTDPNDPTRIVQTGSQRTNGCELGLNGQITRAWQIAGGYTRQDAFVVSATTAAPVGAHVAQVPHHALSLWNLYQVRPKVGAGLGIVHRTDMYAAIDNTVTLPGYTNVDGAVYLSLTARMRVQANVENLFGRRYYINADNNTNISPGAPRGLRVALVSRF
jgi:catecholate siderophore receptor